MLVVQPNDKTPTGPNGLRSERFFTSGTPGLGLSSVFTR